MKKADLLDRYLHAVGFWLPRKQRHDILAELAEDLQSQIEEKEAQLGRSLTDGELEEVLKQRGRPLVVANHYLPQQYLIGPLLFPIYRFVLIVVGICYLVPWLLVAIVLMALSPAFRAEHIDVGWMHGVLTFWGDLWLAGAIAVGVVTIVFAALERGNASKHFLDAWDPRKLPAVRDRNQVPRSGSIIELAALTMFCVFWIGFMWSPVIVNRPDVKIMLSGLWRYFFWGFGLASLAQIPVSALNLVRPYWTPLRAGLRLGTNLATSVLFCWMLKAHIVAQITVSNVPPDRIAHIVDTVNLWVNRCFPLAVLIGVATLIADVYRIVKLKRKALRVTGEVAAML